MLPAVSVQAKTLREGEIDLFHGPKVEALILEVADLDVRSAWHNIF